MAEKTKPLKEKDGGTAGKKPSVPRQEEEKVVTIPLKKKFMKSPRNNRTNRSVREIRLFLARHMKADPSNIYISQQLNESLWKDGIHKRPSKIKVRVSSDEEGKISARLLVEKERPGRMRKKKPGLMGRLTRKKEGPPEGAEKPPAEPEEKKPQGKKEGGISTEGAGAPSGTNSAFKPESKAPAPPAKEEKPQGKKEEPAEKKGKPGEKKKPPEEAAEDVEQDILLEQ